MLAVNMLKGYIKSRHESSVEPFTHHEIIFGIIKFEVDYLADPIRVVLAQVIKIIEHLRINFHLRIPDPRR